MKFVICVALLAFTGLIFGQDAENKGLECDDEFKNAFQSARKDCFEPKGKKEAAGKAEALIGQASSAAIIEILRRKRRENDGVPSKDILNNPEELAKLSKSIVCIETAVAHTTLYQKINETCEEKVAENKDEKVDKRHEKVKCMGELVGEVCEGKLGGWGGDRDERPRQ